MEKWKIWLIELIANGEPVLMNWCVNMDNVKKGKCAAMLPGLNTTDDIYKDAVFTPTNYRPSKNAAL